MSTAAHRASLVFLALTGGAWALVLGIGGAWLLAAGHAVLGSTHAGVIHAGGWTALTAAVLVFTTCVADRVVPGVSRRLVLCTEVPLCVLVVIGMGWVVASLA